MTERRRRLPVRSAPRLGVRHPGSEQRLSIAGLLYVDCGSGARVGMPFDDGGLVFRFTKSNAEGNKSFSTLRATLCNKFMIPPCP